MILVDLKIDETRCDPLLDRITRHPDHAAMTAWLIGGGARSQYTGEKIGDYDFVFKDMKSLVLFRKIIRDVGAKKVSETFSNDRTRMTCEDFVLRYGEEQHEYVYIQMKYELYERVDVQLNTADFTVCQFYMQLGNEVKLGATAQAIEDYNNKHLRIHRMLMPMSTLQRIPKFVARGFVPWNNVKFYQDIIRRIREAPEQAITVGTEPKGKRYKKDWKDEFNIP